jgi:hypothetical protein
VLQPLCLPVVQAGMAGQFARPSLRLYMQKIGSAIDGIGCSLLNKLNSKKFNAVKRQGYF